MKNNGGNWAPKARLANNRMAHKGVIYNHNSIKNCIGQQYVSCHITYRTSGYNQINGLIYTKNRDKSANLLLCNK